MKKALPILISLFCLTNVYAQKIELSIAANSGLFSFAGKSAESTSFINSGVDKSLAYTNNPYGTRNGFSYGLSANAKTVIGKGLLLGLDLGYEKLSSETYITHVAYYNGTTNSNIESNGKTNFNLHFLNIHPNFGYRFDAKTTLDLTAGLDVGLVLNANEKSNARAKDGTDFSVDRERQTIGADIRPRVQLGINLNKFGIYGGYAHGLTNYMKGYIGGGPWEAKSRMIRFGVSYRIK